MSGHTVENYFDSFIHPGHTVAEVIRWKREWLAGARQLGITQEQYDGELWVPIMSPNTSTSPERIQFRGKFKDFATMGTVLQTYLECGFENRVRTIMNCKSAEQWVRVPDEGMAFNKLNATSSESK